MWQQTVDHLVYGVLNLQPDSRLAEALNFFIYDTVKILFLLSAIMFVIAIARSYFPASRARRLLAGRHEFTGNVMAAGLGVVTPFCSCSAVPLFIGFIEAGIPLGITLSFLIASPMVNEVALGLLWIMFGWKVALLYVGSGLAVAIAGGWLLGHLRAERWLEQVSDSFSHSVLAGGTVSGPVNFRRRIDYARGYTGEILDKIWPYIVIAVAVGAFIHGYAPQDLLARYAGRDNFWAVPLAVVIGIPLYANCAGALPIAAVLIDKGMSTGTVLAFMMSVTALSLPEMIILRRVMKIKLIAMFVAIVGAGIIATGYLFNAVL
ncbi:MAG: permease [Negativicutes bacterium]|nr:permease [Negativicutes bacterium]